MARKPAHRDAAKGPGKPGRHGAAAAEEKGGRGRDRKPSPRAGGAEAGPSQRQLRVAEEVRHALSAVFSREEFHDPDLHELHVTVTEVRASPDLKHMTAFVSGLGKDLTAAQFAGLRRVAPFLRTQVARAVRLKFAPDLHFQPDTALDYAMHIDAVMKRPEVARDLSRPEPGAAPPDTDDNQDQDR